MKLNNILRDAKPAKQSSTIPRPFNEFAMAVACIHFVIRSAFLMPLPCCCLSSKDLL